MSANSSGPDEEEQAGAAPGPPRFTRAELSRYNGANAALPAFCASPSGAANPACPLGGAGALIFEFIADGAGRARG